MTPLVVTGAGAVSAAGLGFAAIARQDAAGTHQHTGVTGLYSDPLPYQAAPVVADFDVRSLLGRKGTSFFDRATALAVVACGQALEDGGLLDDERARERTGVALGTTVGSLRSSSEYSRETMVADRPYLVNPVLFPNTVMNCAAGQAAIRYRLHGVNATVADGRLGFLGALRYAANALHRRHADAMLAGAVEEFTPHRAWAHHLRGAAGVPGEAAVVFLLERGNAAALAGRHALTEVVATTAGYHSSADLAGMRDRLVACVRAALARAAVDAGQLDAVAVAEPEYPEDERIGNEALAAVLGGRRAESVRVRDRLGDCGAAAGALQFAALLARLRGQSARAGLLAGWTPEGAVAATVLRGCRDAGADSR